MVYIKDEKGRLKTIKELAREYELPYTLIQSRYFRGIRNINELVQPKYEMVRK